MTDNDTTTVSTLDQLLLDIFTTAMEGGINYWAIANSYHHSFPDESDDHKGFYSDVMDEEDYHDLPEGDEGTWLHIDHSVLTKGYRLATSAVWRGKISWSSEKPPIVVRPGTDWDFDANDADVVVQLGLFGKVIYA